MLKIYLDTQSLHPEHASRGIGVYASLLGRALREYRGVEMCQCADEADLIHYPSFDLFFSSLPLRKRRPTVVTIHDVIPLIFPEAYKPGLKGTARFLHQRFSLGNVKAIITDSQASAADIALHLRVPSHQIFIVPLAAHPQLTSASDKSIQTIRRKYKLPTSYVLYVGDINYNKNIPQLIKMMKYLPWTIKLVLVGKHFVEQPIPEWKAIVTQIALSDVSKRVLFVPDLSPESVDELAAIYTGALCYVQPSLYEGFGLPVLEALQVGTPVVSSDTSSLPEVLGDAGILVEPSAEALATAVKQIMGLKRNERLAMICQGKARSRQFTWHKVAEKTMAVYRHALQTTS